MNGSKEKAVNSGGTHSLKFKTKCENNKTIERQLLRLIYGGHVVTLKRCIGIELIWKGSYISRFLTGVSQGSMLLTPQMKVGAGALWSVVFFQQTCGFKTV